MNPMIPVFEEKKTIAAGVNFNGQGTYTSAMFLEDFKQFTNVQLN